MNFGRIQPVTLHMMTDFIGPLSSLLCSLNGALPPPRQASAVVSAGYTGYTGVSDTES